MTAIFLVTIPITLSINLAVRGYKYKKGRCLKKNIQEILLVKDENLVIQDPLSEIKDAYPHYVYATFEVEVKTRHLVSGTHLKDLVRTQKRYFVILTLVNGSHLVLAFTKQFWETSAELENMEFIVENLKYLDVRFHAHNGSDPLLVETCDIEFPESRKDGKDCIILKAQDDKESYWYHRNKQWSLATNDRNMLLAMQLCQY